MVHELQRQISNEKEMKEKYIQVGEHLFVKPGQELDVDDINVDANKASVVFSMGGSGTRLSHVTRNTYSKHMIPVNWQPLSKYTYDLWRNLKFGNFNFLIDDTHKGSSISEYYGDGSKFGVKNTYSVETKKLSSGGAVKLAIQNKVINDSFVWHQPDDMIVHYDNFPMDFYKVFLAAINKGFEVVILCTPGTLYPYGEVIDENGRVVEFVEKPFISKDSSVGIWGLNKDCFDEVLKLESDKEVRIESTVFKKIARSGKMCKVLLPNDYWVPVNDDTGLKKFEDMIKNHNH